MASNTVFKGSKEGKIVRSEVALQDLKDDQVRVRITASGVCGTDEHHRTKDMVLGHEGVGVVEDVGPGVRHLKKGDRVGWGYQHDSCGACEFCLSGRETYCPERSFYGFADLDQGSFASRATWREPWLFRVPDELSETDAAPLMCGGATVFNALRMYDVQPTERVGVIGIGGLGHLAIQFASKMGCDVVVFSGTDSKRDEAMRLGATEFVATGGKKELEVGRKVDCLLVTTSAPPDWDLVLPVLSPTAKIFPLTVADGDFAIPYMALIGGGYTVQGSVVAPRLLHRQMLDFAARHAIRPVKMEFPLSEAGIRDAMQTLRDGRMRYRGVLVPQG